VVEAGAQGTSVIAAVIDTIHHMVMTRIGSSKMANTGKKTAEAAKTCSITHLHCLPGIQTQA